MPLKYTTAIPAELADAIEVAYQRLEQALKQDFPRPIISMKQRGCAAGSARLQLNELRFNPTLFEQNQPIFLQEVVPHEVCHLVTWHYYGRRVKPHGKEWKGLMQGVFGLAGDAKHQLDVTSVQGRTFTYRCDCGPHELSVRRHNNVLRGKARYHCRRCSSELEPVQDKV